MNKLTTTAIATAAGFMAGAAWSQAPQQGPRFEPKPYFQMPLENDPSRVVRLQSVVIPAGAGNQFHRHPGDQWWAVQEGEVTYTIAARPQGRRVCLRAARHRSPQSEHVGHAGTLDRAQHHRQGQAADRAGGRIAVSADRERASLARGPELVQAGLPPFFLQSARKVLRSLPCRPFAVA